MFLTDNKSIVDLLLCAVNQGYSIETYFKSRKWTRHSQQPLEDGFSLSILRFGAWQTHNFGGALVSLWLSATGWVVKLLSVVVNASRAFMIICERQFICQSCQIGTADAQQRWEGGCLATSIISIIREKGYSDRYVQHIYKNIYIY